MSHPHVLCLAFATGAFCMYGVMWMIDKQPGDTLGLVTISEGVVVEEPRLPANNSVYVNASSTQSIAVRNWLRAQFALMDMDRDGRLDRKDITHVREDMHLHDTYVAKLKAVLGDQDMNLEELAAVRDWIKAQFQLMDEDQDGLLDANDLARISRKMHLSPSYAEKLRNRIGEREMSFGEFKATIKQMELVAATSRDGRDALQTHLISSIFGETISRAALLLGLMVMQSASAMVLGRYETLLKEHVVVMLFLTMLVGAGGNVGNQSVIKVIEQLFSGQLKLDAAACQSILLQQLAVGILLSFILGVGAFIRAFISQYYMRPRDADGVNALRGCIAVTFSLMVIVLTSAVLGTCLPLALIAVGLDVAHAGPSIQVVMDIGGVVITCSISRRILDGGKGHLREVPARQFRVRSKGGGLRARAAVAGRDRDFQEDGGADFY